MTTQNPFPARGESWHKFLPLTLAWLMGVMTALILSPVFLVVWLWSLIERLNRAGMARKTMKNLPPEHEASLP
jgi:hypothetical protein